MTSDNDTKENLQSYLKKEFLKETRVGIFSRTAKKELLTPFFKETVAIAKEVRIH